MDLQPIFTIVVGLIVLAIVWKVISGVIRLVLTLVVIGVVGYFLLNFIR